MILSDEIGEATMMDDKGNLYQQGSQKLNNWNLNKDNWGRRLTLVYPTPEQIKRGKVLPDETCPCGSNKKFKKCCGLLNKATRQSLWTRIFRSAPKKMMEMIGTNS